MNLEGDAIEEDKTSEHPPSTLFLTVLYLKNGSKKIPKNMEIEIEPELMMEYFSLYVSALRLEDMKRKKDVEIPQSSLPTLKNIFDSNKDISIKWLK